MMEATDVVWQLVDLTRTWVCKACRCDQTSGRSFRQIWIPGPLVEVICMPCDYKQWTGPLDGDLEPDGMTLKHPVPGERWPFGPPHAHQRWCRLYDQLTGGSYCDCAASDASDTEWGMSS